jgi:hypothetical protein
LYPDRSTPTAFVRVALTLFALLVAAGCAHPSLSAGGHVAADSRLFVLSPKYAGQAQADSVSIAAEPEFKVTTEDSVHTATLRPFYRLDPVDERRTHADLRDASYRLSLGSFEGALGVGTFTWGVLESHRPSDVVNQIDFVEGPTGSAKLGQPFAQLGWSSSRVTVRGYALPYFRDRTFPGVRGRLRFPVTVDTDGAAIDSRFGRWHPSGALRASFELGDADIGIGAFTGLSREPRFVAELTTGQVAPRYEPMHQGSADLQWALGAFVIKADAFGRIWQPGEFFFGGGAGVDYMLPKFIGTLELTFAAEYLFDSRPREAPPTFFEHDAFGGFRLGFGDEASTEATGGAIVDVFDGTTFGHLDASRRFGDHWRVKLEANVYFASSKKLEGGFERDHYGQAQLAYFF